MKHATVCALLSEAIYHDCPFDRMKELGFPPGKIIERAAECAWIVQHPGGPVYIVFRGTHCGAEWMSNFNAPKTKLAALAVKVHYGFLSGLLNIYSEILTQLCRMGGTEKNKLVVCGHSRGAAFAQIFALKAYEAGYMVDEVHLFGAPRALAPDAAEAFDKGFAFRCWRWVNNNDAVTRVPPRWMGFRHVGREMYFGAAGNYEPNPSRWVKFKGQLSGRIRGLFTLHPFDGASDHSMSGYVSLLCRYMRAHSSLMRQSRPATGYSRGCRSRPYPRSSTRPAS